MLTTFFSRRFIQRKCYNNVIKLSSCEKWNIFYSYIFKPARKTVVYCPKFDHLWLIVLFSFFCFLRHGLDWKMRHIGGCHRPSVWYTFVSDFKVFWPHSVFGPKGGTAKNATSRGGHLFFRVRFRGGKWFFKIHFFQFFPSHSSSWTIT